MPANSPSTPPPSSSADRDRAQPPAKTPSAIAASETAATTPAGVVGLRGELVGGSVAPSRTAAIGGTRVARRAGRMLASSVIPMPTPSRRDRARRDDRRPLRQLDAHGVEQHDHALRDPVSDHEAERRGEQAEHEALEHDRAHDLLARGAERPQRRELTRALGDGDRERVEDHERADQQRDAAEGQQEASGSSRSRAPSLRGLVERGLAVLDLQVGGEQRLDGATSSRPTCPAWPRSRSSRSDPSRWNSVWAVLMSQAARLGRAAGRRQPYETMPASLNVCRVPNVEMTIESPSL